MKHGEFVNVKRQRHKRMTNDAMPVTKLLIGNSLVTCACHTPGGDVMDRFVTRRDSNSDVVSMLESKRAC